ncbi:MAG: hypothetical protein K2L07_15435 [Lachnospiraceae bacterium]|nr:hypothetical protein [Lachnospiraceae bacterium]
MKNTKKQKKIYRLKYITIDEVVKYYLKLQHDGAFDGVKLEFIPSVYSSDPQPKVINKGDSSRKSINLLSEKFIYLIHLIRNRQIANYGGIAPFSATMLESIFGKDYKRMIATLLKMGLLQCDFYYYIGEKSYGYRFYDEVEFTYTLENVGYLSKYSDKAKKLLEKASTNAEKEAKQNLGNNILYDRYNQSLKLLNMRYMNDCYRYLSLHNFLSDTSRDYYNYIVDYYLHDIPIINSIDRNQRIYSIATSTPRLLKPFLNIKFSCDIHNSHPLLFNIILYDYYNISLPLRKQLSLTFTTLSITPHNVRRNIRRLLINSGIYGDEIAHIPADVLSYMYITTIGRFWDMVIATDNDDTLLLRSDIKVLMFAEVFYSKKLTTRGKKYAKVFRRQFPNVYKVVRKQKESNRTRLANDMMKLESKLFHEILMKLYNKRYKVVSIHDAIVVLDVKANKNCTVDVVRDIITKIYTSAGLHPDISVDYYGKEYVEKVLEDEERVNRLITSFTMDLHNLCEEGDEEANQIKRQLDRFEIELLPSQDYSKVLLHPRKIR